MSQQRDYQPCFAHVPDSWQGRWALLREFVRRWYGFSLGPVGAHSNLVDREEGKLGLQLPPSFREWISFAEELYAQNAFRILRDDYKVTRLEGHSAISLIMQGEGDVYWAVKEEDFQSEDPPVHTYFVDFEKNEIEHDGLDSSCITTFVLKHLAVYLEGKGGGFGAEVKVTEAFLAEMRRVFPVAVSFDHLQVFEMENIFAMIEPSRFGCGHRLSVEVWRPIPMDRIPACVLACTKNGGWFRGAFIPVDPREIAKTILVIGCFLAFVIFLVLAIAFPWPWKW